MAVKNPKGNTGKPSNQLFSPGGDNKTLHKVSLSSFNMSAYKTTLEDFNILQKQLDKLRVHIINDIVQALLMK